MVNYQPVFIIGAGRSGTKYLRDTLFASESCTRVPYDVGFLWRYGNEGLNHDEITADSISARQVEWIRNKLFTLSDRDNPRPNATLFLEKSVPNSLRVALLHRCFPHAKFIQIIRDGRAVTESAMRMWEAPAEGGYLLDKIRYFPWSNYRYAMWFVLNRLRRENNMIPPIWGPRYKGIQGDLNKFPLHVICAKQWARCVENANAQFTDIPSGQTMTVRYEELMEDAAILERLCAFIGIESESVVKHWQKTVQKGNDEKWKTALSPSQLADVNEIFSGLPTHLHRYIFS